MPARSRRHAPRPARGRRKQGGGAAADRGGLGRDAGGVQAGELRVLGGSGIKDHLAACHATVGRAHPSLRLRVCDACMHAGEAGGLLERGVVRARCAQEHA